MVGSLGSGAAGGQDEGRYALRSSAIPREAEPNPSGHGTPTNSAKFTFENKTYTITPLPSTSATSFTTLRIPGTRYRELYQSSDIFRSNELVQDSEPVQSHELVQSHDNSITRGKRPISPQGHGAFITLRYKSKPDDGAEEDQTANLDQDSAIDVATPADHSIAAWPSIDNRDPAFYGGDSFVNSSGNLFQQLAGADGSQGLGGPPQATTSRPEVPSFAPASKKRKRKVVTLKLPPGWHLDENMQPVHDPNDVSSIIKGVVDDLYDVQSKTHGFIPETQSLLIDKIGDISDKLARLKDVTDPNITPNNPIHNVRIAPEIVDYVDEGRNPDIFTREFVENVQRGNAVINGKKQAFRDFSVILAQKMKEGVGGVDSQVDRIMQNAGLEKELAEAEKKAREKREREGADAGAQNGTS
jgi:mediator of RNA polymerase II transcription subunit 10